jgi:pimeloyl-ACP methyl ester carboxylesterase
VKRLALACAVFACAAPAQAAVTAAIAPTRVARVGELRVAYRSLGSGRPLVMVMGLGGSMDAWPPSFVDALVRRGHRVVLLDNEGVGRSSSVAAPLTVRRMADSTAGLIRRLGLHRPDVAGWSMGGMIVQSLLVRHPALARRAVLMSTAPGDGRATPPDPAALSSLAHDPLGLLGLLFGSGAAPGAVTGYITDIARRPGFAPQTSDAVRARQLAASAEWVGGRDPDGARIARLTLPVLVGGGKEDKILPVGNQIHLARTIERAVYVDYPGAAHGFYIQESADFLPRMLRFLRP